MLDLETINKRALEIGKKENVSQIEAFAIKGRMRNVYVENSDIHIATENTWIGLGIKSIVGKKVGFMSGIVSGENDIERIVKESVSLARISPEDKNFKSLPSVTEKPISSNVGFDKESLNMPMENLVSFANEIVNAAEKDDVKVMNGLLRVNDYKFQISNSLGVNGSHQGTFIFVHFLAKKDMSEGVEKAYSARFKDLNPDKIGESLYRKTMLVLNSKSFKGSKKVSAIINPVELEGLISSTINIAISGENVNKKRSPWINKLGEKVASENLTILDNPLLPEGPRSAPIDDEGVITKKKAIIEKGVLKTFIFDSYNGLIADAELTGNGFRRGTRSIEGAHKTVALCAPSNLEVVTTNKSLDDLVNETKFGILIEKFAAPSADGFTGNFGLEIRSGILIENGELTQPIKHALLVGNFYEGLRKISGIANESQLIENVKTPAIKFEDFQIVGQ